ncbi:MAG: ATP-binding protein [Bacilli bacterium]|nr:ATP-binding protein [Bacilli bacterium]
MVQLYFTMFFTFASQMIASLMLLIPKKLKFRSRPYLRIPASLILIYGTSVGLFFLTTKVIPWSIGWNIGIYTIFIVAIFLGFYNAYAYRFWDMFLMILFAYTMQHIIYHVTDLVLFTGVQAAIASCFAEADLWIADVIMDMLQIAVYALGFTALYIFVCKPYEKVARDVFATRAMIPLAISLYFIVVVANAYASNYTQAPWMQPLKIVLDITFSWICITYEIAIIHGFRYGAMQREMTVVTTTLNAKLAEHMKTEQNMSFINMKCHDLRKQIRAMRQRGTTPSTEDFDLLEQSLYFFDTGIRTGSHNIDVLIQEKQLYCRSRDIEFTSLIDGEAFSKMDYSDQYFLFMNIIDNAIEATEKLSDPSLKTIALTAEKEKGVIIIECVNYFEGDRKIDDEGHLLTTKEDPKNHGFGTRSIEHIVNKYGGTASYGIEGNVFTLKIAI